MDLGVSTPWGKDRAGSSSASPAGDGNQMPRHPRGHPLRVLCYISTRFFEGGGLSAVMLNYYRALWSRPELSGRFVIDVVSHGEIDPGLLAEVESNGGRYLPLPSRASGPVGHTREFTRVLREGRYDVLHYNYDSGLDAIELALAHRNVPLLVCHVHNSRPRHGIVNGALRPLVRRSYDRAVACSQEAGAALFGGAADFTVLNNAVDVGKFAYDPRVRARLRSDLGVSEDAFVIGNVGRMNAENVKNHGFLIRSFALAHERRPNTRLVIVGDGDLMPDWVSLADDLGVSDHVTFAGFQTNVSEWMQAFDLFCFPSRWEGLGMAAVEAQAAGLRVIASEAVPGAAAVTPNVIFLPIREGCERLWSEAICECEASRRVPDRGSPDIAAQIREAGYDIGVEARKLAAIYGVDPLDPPLHA